MPRHRIPDLDALLSHTGWVRRLAHGLVRDVHVAEDVAQETCLRALERPPADGANLRGWLATVLRNLVRQRDRAEVRRVRHERQASRAATAPATADLVSRVAGQRDLVSLVLELDEPYLTTIMLRYFEERSPRQIAQQQGVPVKTVHTRIARGLALLRAKLAARHGRHRWALALTPLARGPYTPLPLLGGVLMKSKIVLALGAVMVVGGALLLFVQPWGSPPGPEVGTQAVDGTGAVAAGELDAAAGLRAAPPSGERTAVVEAPGEPVPAPVARTVRGRVFAVDGRPLSGIDVGWSPDQQSAVATSDLGGWFEAGVRSGSGQLVATSPELATLYAGLPMRAVEFPVAVVVAPALPLEGHVVDGDGEPIAGAHVEVLLPDGFRPGFEAILDASSESRWVARTDELGHFDLRQAGRVPEARLFARADGWQSFAGELPGVPRDDIRIVLERPARTPTSLTGVVVDARGAPVPDAHVSFGRQIAVTDRLGGFVLPDRGGGGRLMAVKAGYLPAVLGEPPSGEGQVVLRLGERALSIRGRVIGPDGAGIAGMRVWLKDPTPFGSLDRQPGMTAAEAMAAGAPRPADVAGDARGPARQPSLDWHFVGTSADGGFEIGGMMDRSYVLLAMDPETMLVTQTPPIPAGTLDARVRLDRGVLHESITGRVVDGSGTPVPGVRVTPVIDAIVMPFGTGTDTRHDSRPGTTTDEQGRFQLRNVPREHVYLSFRGVRILPHEVGRGLAGGFAEAAGTVDGVEVVVSLRTHIKLEVTGGRYDQLAILDGSGEPVSLTLVVGDSTRSSDRLALVAGQGPMFVVDDSARTLVLFKDGVEVLREPLQLVLGQVNRLVY